MTEQTVLLSPDELKAYRDELIRVLNHQIKLLHEMSSLSLVPEHQENNDLVIDSKHLPEMLQLLEGEKYKLENFDVILAVVGTMKAGKSTTINAIIGKEIMPNRNRPMTAIPTLICHTKGQLEPKISFDNGPINQLLKDIQTYATKNPGCSKQLTTEELKKLLHDIQHQNLQFETEYTGPDAIFNVLSGFNDLVRLADVFNLVFPFEQYKEVKNLPMIEVEFAYLKNHDASLGRLMLLDTPGPNETKQAHLRVMLNEQLKRSSAVILVLDYTQLKSEAEADVRDQLKRIPKVDQNRLYAFVNKFDLENANADDENSTKELIFNDLLKDDIKLEHIYPISAQDAYLANRMQDYMSKHDGVKPKYVDKTWVSDFARKAFGQTDAEEWEDYSDKSIYKRIEKLLTNSHIQSPMDSVIVKANSNAPYLAMRSALDDVESIFNSVKNVFSINGYFNKQVEINEQELRNIEQTIIQLNQDKGHLQTTAKKVVDEVKKRVMALEHDVIEHVDFIVEEITQKLKSDITIIKDNIVAGVTTYEQDAKREHSLKEYFSKFESGEAVKQAKQEALQRVAAAKKAKEKNKSRSETNFSTITFDSETKKNAFIEKINTWLTDLPIAVYSAMDKATQSYNKELSEFFASTQIEFSSSFDSVKRRFSNQGIDLFFHIPNHLNLTHGQNENLSWNQSWLKKEETHESIVDQPGTWGATKRWFGGLVNTNWGKTEISFTTFEIDIKKMIEDINVLFDISIKQPLLEEISMDFHYKTQEIEEYLTYIQHEAAVLINELEQAVELEKQPYDTKKQRKSSMNKLALMNNQVTEDIQMIKTAITSEATVV